MTRSRLNTLQALRGVAALFVVVTHSFQMINMNGGSSVFEERYGFLETLGGLGVEIFFGLSGFIMAYNFAERVYKRGGTRDFLIRRAFRILPLYWFYTSVIVIFVILPFTLTKAFFDPLYIGASYLFIPLQNPWNGSYHPLLDQGWTLVYELYFYFLFALLLRFDILKGIVALFIFFTLSVLVGQIIDSDSIYVKILTNPLLIDFSIGAVLGYVFGKNITLKSWILWTAAAISLGVIIIHISGVVFWGSWLGFGVSAAILLFSLVSLERRGLVKYPTFMVRWGDVSYSLYLSHSIITLTVGGLLRRKLFFDLLHPLAIIGFVVITALILANLSYFLLEKPITDKLNGFYKARKA